MTEEEELIRQQEMDRYNWQLEKIQMDMEDEMTIQQEIDRINWQIEKELLDEACQYEVWTENLEGDYEKRTFQF